MVIAIAVFVFGFKAICIIYIDLLQIWVAGGKYWQNFKFEKP